MSNCDDSEGCLPGRGYSEQRNANMRGSLASILNPALASLGAMFLLPSPVLASKNDEANSQATSGENIAAEYNVRIPMRDGVTLSADIYRPAAYGKYPVIVARNPYTKSTVWAERARLWAKNGYVFVLQDVRGRGDSDGIFEPWVNEVADGIDSYQWSKDQPWSSGKVGGYGGSYSASTQLYPAATGKSGLDAMMLLSSPPDLDRGFPVQQGVVIPAAAAWLASIDGRMYQRLDQVDLDAAYGGRPLVDMDKRLGRHLSAWREWVTNATNEDYWKKMSYQDALVKQDLPGIWIAGWYDDVLAGTTENFAALTAAGASRQWLVIGPWGHAVNAGRKLGEIDFGPDAVIDLEGLQKSWYDRWLKGDRTAFDQPHVKLFVMGSNKWIQQNAWPIAETVYTPYYLHSNGNANGLQGNGTLSSAKPVKKEPADRYKFNPVNPVPFAAGSDSKQLGGPDDYRDVEKRQDVLVYTTPAHKQTMRVCGPLKAKLFAASSAQDTDWTAKLLLVHPDGFARRLNDGIVRAKYRNGFTKAVLLTPGKIEEYSIDLWATCIDVQPGYRLRLEISSSAFGKYDVNLNTGSDQATATEAVVAEQRIYHDSEHASHILLPIVPIKDH